MSSHNLIHSMKAFYQEWTARRSLTYYRRLADRSGIRPDEFDLATALRKRVQPRVRGPKKKGDLHIFLAASINNWEAILPVVLAPFGKVTTFDWPQGGYCESREQWLRERENLNKKMLAAFNEAHAQRTVDVVVGYLSIFNTSPETLMTMASMGAVILNFCWDDKLYFSGTVKDQEVGPGKLSHVIDMNLTNSPDSCIKYLACGGLAMFWPEAAHPEIHRPYNDKLEFDVSFVGRKYGWRGDFIQRLKRDGINVVAFGSGWENGALSDTEMIRLYSRSRINLGFSGVGYSRRLFCLKGRDFEVPMSGGLYLTQDNPELKLVYDVGKEIATYQNYSHCLQQIRWLLNHPNQAQEIRYTGRRRALKEHTWDSRFTQILCMSGILETNKSNSEIDNNH